jgi:hypothetical protein
MGPRPTEGLSQDPLQQPPQRDLPAAYRNPWSTLGDNLQAVAADVRLRVQELWRRNGQGSLWRPGWWPSDLAPVFWPLVVALALSALLVLGAQAASLMHRLPSPARTASSSMAVDAMPAAEPEASDAALEPMPSALTPPTPPAAVPPQPPIEVPSTESGDVAADLEPEQEAKPEPLDPLAELLQRSDAEGLLAAATASADQRTLVLGVVPGFAALPVGKQQLYADQWQQWAVDLGYDHLELRDSRAGLLARDALVGAGMIVLNESSSP